ncbi:MAG TPA: alpha/beta fold hydrolase [Gaiellaceae bacterium]|nr:alpha/beta fold hydrolase [Gaiellaceae bacterium]
MADEGASLSLAAGKQRALLALLLLNANRAVAASQLVDDLWGEGAPETAPKMVQIYVSRLRKALPNGRLETRGAAYAICVEPDELDLERFRRLVAEARGAAATRPEEAATKLREALTLWRGPALSEFDEPFARIERAHLEELRLSALEERIEAELALARHAELVPELESVVARYPLRERLRAQQLVALYRSGRQADALGAYASYRSTLDEELGIAPSAALRELERRILNQDPALLASSPQPLAKADLDLEAPVARTVPSGREAESGALRSALAEALQGRCRLVLVTGEAGVGKTTLVDDLVETEARAHRALVARGQSLDQRGAGEPYLPLLDALGALAREAHDVVPDVLATHAPSWLLQMPWLVSEQASEQDADDLRRRAAGTTGQGMLRELAEALAALSADRPVVLVLEDLHWSDPSTLDAIEFVVRRSDRARLLIIGTYASEGAPEPAVASLAAELRVRRLCSIVELRTLDESALEDVVERRLPGIQSPDELAALLHARTGGNPLFVENVIDAWVESGAVVPQGAGWSLSRDVAQLARAVPPTLRALIEQDLGVLPGGERRVLEAVSVAGGEVPVHALSLALDLELLDVERACTGLARRRLLTRAGTTEWPDGSRSQAYRFVHELQEQVAYEQIAAPERRGLHASLAGALEDAYADTAPEIAPALARHHVRGGSPERAVPYLRLTAELALRRTAHREALELLTNALEIVAALPEGASRDRLELELRTLLGRTQVLRDGWSSQDAERAFTDAREICERLEDREPLVPILIALATIHEVRGDFERAHEMLERCLDVVSPEDTDRRIEAHEILACSLMHRGAFAGALRQAERGVELYRSASYRPVVVSLGDDSAVACHDWIALSLWFLGFPDQARDRAHEAVAMAQEPSRSYGLAAATAQAAVVHQFRRDVEEALEWATRTIELAEERRYTYRAAMGRILTGWARAVSGGAGAGIPEIRAAIESARSTGITMDDAYFLALLADACLAAGRLDEGVEAVQEALGAIADPESSFVGAELLRLRGELLLAQGEPGHADLRRALEIARKQEALSLELRAATSLARREEPGAREELRSILDRFEEGHEVPDLTDARLVLAERPREGAGAKATDFRPPVSYARSGTLSIAYQVTGGGSLDIVLVPGFVSHLDLDWDEPRHAHFLDRLGSLGRLVRFDKRGTGLSDRPGDLPDLETRMDDVRAVMDAVGCERAVVFGYSEGASMAIQFAATYPERVLALVLYGGYAARTRSDEYPWAQTSEERRAYAEQIEREWGWEADMRRMCPNADEAMARWWGERARAAASPGAARALIEMNSLIDVRATLPSVRVPTLVLHRVGDVDVRIEEARYLAENVPGARLVELPGVDHFVSVDPEQILDEVERFLHDVDRTSHSSRSVKTILMSDLVGSTETARALGDRAWSALLDSHHAAMRDVLREFEGEEIEITGDGALALFDGPARAIRAAAAMRHRLASLGLDVRIGIHTGEVERRSGSVRGIAVHVAARVTAEAGAGDVVVTGTTHDLVAGSGVSFESLGRRELRGLGEPWSVYCVTGLAPSGR